MTEIVMRTCSPLDVETLKEISMNTFKETFESLNTPEDMQLYLNKKFTSQEVTKEVNDKDSMFFLALNENEAIGYAKINIGKDIAEFPKSKALEIERLYCIKKYIGKNVGKKLMDTCLEFAERNHFDIVWLGVWEHNNTAISFYGKFGFEKFGSQIFMLGNDAQTDLLMKKNIGQ